MSIQPKRTIQIGFSQRIQLDWLERTAQLFREGAVRNEIEENLQDYLKDSLSKGGTAKRGNREKAISILLKTWVTVPKRLESFRNDGLLIFSRTGIDAHLPIHWGMSMAVYPFFGAVARTLGRLLKLQGTATASQVQKRIKEQLGERETVARAARRILSCFRDWGVLVDTEKKGVYMSAPRNDLNDGSTNAWLAEGALVANDARALPINLFREMPEFFPFRFGQISLKDLEKSKRLSVYRHGLDEDMVALHSKNGMP